MINKEKIWFLTLFSIILVLSVYYYSLPSESLSSLLESQSITSNDAVFEADESDVLATLRIQDDEEVLSALSELQEVLLGDASAEEKSNAYDKMQTINFNKGKEKALEDIILSTYNIKSFIKIKDDQISVTIVSNKHSAVDANNIIRTIQNEFAEKKYITVKYK